MSEDPTYSNDFLASQARGHAAEMDKCLVELYRRGIEITVSSNGSGRNLNSTVEIGAQLRSMSWHTDLQIFRRSKIG